MPAFHLLRCAVAIGGDAGNQVCRDRTRPIVFPELPILQFIHGEEAITDVHVVGQWNTTNDEVLERLRVLYDPEVLKACIPGCQSLEVTGPNEFLAVATNKVGPVKATFKGKVRLTDLDPPNGYKISGEGDGGIAGFAKGGASVTLTEKDGGTLLTYNVEAQIGGKLAQLGQRLVNGAAKKLADDFFVRFAAAVKN